MVFVNSKFLMAFPVVSGKNLWGIVKQMFWYIGEKILHLATLILSTILHKDIESIKNEGAMCSKNTYSLEDEQNKDRLFKAIFGIFL